MLRAMIVDDEAPARSELRYLLEETGRIDGIMEASSAREAVERLMDGKVDVMFLDIQMPKMDGYEATRQIRALPDAAKAGIPIFAMTANAFEEDRQNALKAGMDGHIAKPLDIPHLLQVLADVLKS